MKTVTRLIIRNLIVITLAVYISITFSIRSEVVIGRAVILEKQIFNHHALSINNQVYWLNNHKILNSNFINKDKAYIYSYSLFLPKWRIITDIKALDR